MSIDNLCLKIILFVVNRPAHLPIRLSTAYLSCLNDGGFRPISLGISLNAYHWRKTLHDEISVHVLYFLGQPSSYVHWDLVDPAIAPMEHLRRDYPSGYQSMVEVTIIITIFLGFYLLSKYGEGQRN